MLEKIVRNANESFPFVNNMYLYFRDYIIDEIMRNWQEAVPPLPDPEIEEERRAAAQQETKESGVHQLDLYLRSCISNFMQEKQNQISKLGSQNIVKEVAIEKKRILGVYKSDSQQIDVLKIQLSDFLESLLLE
eukprot:TRINITY_DN978_c0_g3_i2.p3 TRINITY_DN978_c0_g3~~TRINITY_DN978_c0_g3_i2.p3  ORF type:complete len:134 (-),score=14.30 TRINITY_DN978_c0_g3_i2:217-618(-)